MLVSCLLQSGLPVMASPLASTAPLEHGPTEIARLMTATAFTSLGDDGQLSSMLEASPMLHDAKKVGGNAVIAVLRAGVVAFDREDWVRCDSAARHILDLAAQKLYETHWTAVPLVWRQLYGWCSAMYAVALAAAQPSRVSDALSVADKGLLLGAPISGVDLTSLATALQSLVPATPLAQTPLGTQPSGSPPSTTGTLVSQSSVKRRRVVAPPISDTTSVVPRVQCPSVLAFAEQWAASCEPVVITGAIGHWPALRKWADPKYLLSVAGKRLVPVETGGSYTADEWRQELMTLHDMISRFGADPWDLHQSDDDCKDIEEATVYLAQHDIFAQIPELADDISVPDYCCCIGSGEPPQVNAWFGPAGTVSPLHYDRYHNMLCQVVGRKRVLMFAPSDSHRLYAHPDPMLHNTSRVDVVEPDLAAFPLFAEAKRFECVLGPGDMLYIPPHWWHHVTSLSVSFSVSHWFGGEDAV